jgi:glutamate/tyrosine decarboxylase-like PLP-dependent enzyme
MTPEEFRVAGHALIDWIADDRNHLANRRVLPDVQPGDIRAMLPASPPTVRDASFAPLLAELDRVVVPGMTSVQHPRHFGWFPSNASLASVLGDIASSGLGGLGISWESNPALTEVEEVMCDWMRQLCGLSDQWLGTIQDTASTAVFVALLTARERSSGDSFSRGGLVENKSALRVYTTSQAHSSVMKAALLAGFGADNVRMVEAIQARLRRDLENAAWFAEQVRAEPGWSVVAPVTLQTICVRHTPAGMDGDALDAHTLGWIRRINSSGKAFCSPSQLDGQWMVRVSIGVESTERSDIQFLWDLFRSEVRVTAPS